MIYLLFSFVENVYKIFIKVVNYYSLIYKIYFILFYIISSNFMIIYGIQFNFIYMQPQNEIDRLTLLLLRRCTYCSSIVSLDIFNTFIHMQHSLQ